MVLIKTLAYYGLIAHDSSTSFLKYIDEKDCNEPVPSRTDIFQQNLASQ
jgi:hypothetical protein